MPNQIKIKNLKNQLEKMNHKKLRLNSLKSKTTIKKSHKRKKRNRRKHKFWNKRKKYKKLRRKKIYRNLRIFLMKKKKKYKLKSKLPSNKSSQNKNSLYNLIQIIIWHQCRPRWQELQSFPQNKMLKKNWRKRKKDNKKMNEGH